MRYVLIISYKGRYLIIKSDMLIIFGVNDVLKKEIRLSAFYLDITLDIFHVILIMTKEIQSSVFLVFIPFIKRNIIFFFYIIPSRYKDIHKYLKY